MSERLTVSLEDGIPDKLRQLAGGERKVGAYLSGVVAWLWANKEKLDAYNPSSINVEKGEEIEEQIHTLFQSYNEINRKIDSLETFVKFATEAIATQDEDKMAAVRQSLIQQGLLTPQEHSSQNDA